MDCRRESPAIESVAVSNIYDTVLGPFLTALVNTTSTSPRSNTMGSSQSRTSKESKRYSRVDQLKSMLRRPAGRSPQEDDEKPHDACVEQQEVTSSEHETPTYDTRASPVNAAYDMWLCRYLTWNLISNYNLILQHLPQCQPQFLVK